MRLDIDALTGRDGWATRDQLLACVSPRSLVKLVATGALVRLDEGVFATPAAAGRWRVRVEAVLARREGVASHATALALWGLIEPQSGPVHVTVDSFRSGRGTAGVVLHRAPDPHGDRRRIDGLSVSSVERSVVDTWGSPGALTRSDLRAAAITAVRRRLCAPRDLAHEVAKRSRLPARAELVDLIGLLEIGCQSELEIWGCRNVLRAPGMPDFVQQLRVPVAGQVFVLDAACEELLLAVEMDGAAWHGSRPQRERDIRRDALLATAGWQTLRFSYARLTRSTEECRRDIRSVAAARRALIGNRVR